MADRYTYVPLIGIFIMLVCLAVEVAAAAPRGAWVLWPVALVVLLACFGTTRRQLQHWKNSETLFRQAARVTRNNYVAYNNLGNAVTNQEAALKYLRIALQFKPDHAPAHNNVGRLLLADGKLDEAAAHLRMALRLEPRHAKPHCNLGNVLAAQGRLDEAIAQYQEAVRLKPDYGAAHNSLAAVLAKQGEFADAVAHFSLALQYGADPAQALNNLAWILATCREAQHRNGVEAVKLADRAVELTRNKEAVVLDTLAAAYAEAGRFSEAVRTVREALALAEATGSKPLVDAIRERLKLYQSGQAYRE